MVTWNKTKIVATIGPASFNRYQLRSMLLAGADLIRINGAHSSLDECRKMIAMIRGVAQRENYPAAILLDLPGPKFRVGRLKTEPIRLKGGGVVRLICGKSVQTDERIPVRNRNIHQSLKPGGRIFINDGLVELAVVKVDGRDIECRVRTGGIIMSGKGINLPRTRLKVPSLTTQDKELLSLVIEEDVDYVALSFVRSAKNIIALKNILKRKAPHIGIIAKIEKPEALDNLNDIIDVSDAIMVARGDLGIEVPFDKVPLIQRDILARCMTKGKPSITATQMLESMISSKTPTRAEATDVAGAVWEGSDAIMLSAETSIGQNPATAVKAMAQIATEAERQMPKFRFTERVSDRSAFQAQVISRAATFLARHLKAKAIVTPTRTGRTALFVSRERPDMLILAPTEDEFVARRMSLFWGVRPITMPTFSTVGEMLACAEDVALKSGFIKKGNTIIIASGAHGSKGDITRLVEVRHV